jgi:hypothetical protein
MKQTQTKSASQTKKTTPSAGMGTLFDKGNYTWMLIGIGIMILGFLLMAGGRSPNPNEFLPNEVYGTRRITIAPIVILAGLIVMIYAIFRTPKNSEATKA